MRTPIVVLLLSACASACSGAKGLERRQGPAYQDEVASWRAALDQAAADGMILVVRGYHAGDDFIAVMSNAEYSHAMVLDLGRGEVIEAVGEGVIVTPLAKVLSESHQIMLIRPADFTVDAGRAALARARTTVGAGYDYTGIVGAPSRDRYYCSELAAWSWNVPVDRWGPGAVIHPEQLTALGEVLFTSGPRDGKPDAVGRAAAPAAP
ncbi:MAG: hypothetical protein KBG28_10290 [Kofleriaceae bacterium]|jgi:uncharacterized protein YycO|nr:hypothetical protein [Kofleriaceae bacterium]